MHPVVPAILVVVDILGGYNRHRHSFPVEQEGADRPFSPGWFATHGPVDFANS